MQACVLMLLFCHGVVCKIPKTKLRVVQEIEQTAHRLDSLVPMPWLYAIAAAESRFDPFAESPVGAYGTYQIMPIAERHVNILAGTRLDRYYWKDNIELGIRYLNHLHSRFNSLEDVLVAYNWGASNVGSLVLPIETTMYIDRIKRTLKQCS